MRTCSLSVKHGQVSKQSMASFFTAKIVCGSVCRGSAKTPVSKHVLIKAKLLRE